MLIFNNHISNHRYKYNIYQVSTISTILGVLLLLLYISNMYIGITLNSILLH